MTSALARPVPAPTALSRPFWDACRDKRLLVQRCDACGQHVFTPQEFCSACQSMTLTWVESAGSGTIVTFTVVWRPQTPAFSAPYVVAVVRLAEGYEMMTNIVDAELESVRIGAPVGVRFLDVDEHITLPCFALA